MPVCVLKIVGRAAMTVPLLPKISASLKTVPQKSYFKSERWRKPLRPCLHHYVIAVPVISLSAVYLFQIYQILLFWKKFTMSFKFF